VTGRERLGPPHPHAARAVDSALSLATAAGHGNAWWRRRGPILVPVDRLGSASRLIPARAAPDGGETDMTPWPGGQPGAAHAPASRGVARAPGSGLAAARASAVGGGGNRWGSGSTGAVPHPAARAGSSGAPRHPQSELRLSREPTGAPPRVPRAGGEGGLDADGTAAFESQRKAPPGAMTQSGGRGRAVVPVPRRESAADDHQAGPATSRHQDGPRSQRVGVISASRKSRSRWQSSAGAHGGEGGTGLIWHGQNLLFPRVPVVLPDAGTDPLTRATPAGCAVAD